FPSTSWSRDTTCGSKEVFAISKTSVKMPARKLTTYRYSIRKMPHRAMRGTAPISTARPRSAPISRGRRRTRSTHTPTRRLNSKAGIVPTAPRTPICAGLACSVTTAVSGSARLVIAEPKFEIIAPIHRVRKSRCRHKLALCWGIQALLVYHCDAILYGVQPNAGAHLLLEAGATEERTLESVRCSAWFGVVPSPVRSRQAPPAHDRQGIRSKRRHLFMPCALRAGHQR